MKLKVQSVKEKPKKMRMVSNRKKRNKIKSIEPKLDYKLLYEGSPILQRTINRQGIIIACNDLYAERFGYSKKQIIGKSIFNHIAKKSHDEMKKTFNTWKRTGLVHNREIWFKRKDKTVFLGLLSATNIYDSKKRLIGSNTAIRDITMLHNARKKIQENENRIRKQFTELKKTNSLLLSTEQKYRNLYEKTPALLRSINVDGIITDCNDAYAKNLGYSKKEILGMSIFDHTAEKSIKDMKQDMSQWRKTDMISQMEIWLKRKNGIIFPTLLSGTSLYDENGKTIGRTVSLTDLTQIYLAKEKIEQREAQIREQLKNLKKLTKVKDEFLTMITHELKTPLVPINSYVDILLSGVLGPLNEAQKNRLEIMKSSSKSLLKLISDILDAQKIELGQLTLKKESYDIAGIINDAVNKMKPIVERNGISITTELHKGISCQCDKIRIEQVLSNLITNSLDFCSKEIGNIHIKLHSQDNSVKIIVKDNGIGIVKSSLDKIFVKFYQADTTTIREHGGTGIGLSVCKGIIEGHGGKIWAESEGRGKGTEIHILLPLTKS
ncbi:MAG TPA: PAS domain-containing sensor histidine kinase [Nitrosopumilaceae archaeon]|nr:PAS domain-containing sensor histidine kinase [Nitrosopumilaceae archaeon]